MAKSKRAATAAWRTYRDVSRPGSPGLMTRLRAIPRMIGAAGSGRYPDLAKSKLVMLAASIIYIVSPIDFIPDILLPFGVVDDFGIFVWLSTSLLGESGRYVDWERKQIKGTKAPPA